MKILVFSDSHGDIETMDKVVRATKPDMVLHLGDLIADAIELERRFPDIPIEFVRGNCDLWTTVSDEKEIEADGYRILMSHGDKYGVRTGYSTYLKEGKKRNMDIILCGHTHMSHLVKKGGMWLMNPGKAGERARGPFKTSFGIIDTANGLNCSVEKVFAVV